MNPDDLDALLSPPSDAPQESRREELYTATFHHLRVQKRRREVLRLGGYALLLTLGVALGWTLKPQPQHAVPQVARQTNPPPTVRPLRTGPQLELEAESTDDLLHSAQLYREAGDRFLEDGNDVRSALRCYQQYLELQGARPQPAALNDSWLLLSLKRAHTQGDVQ